ncbi:MAG: hypothetical protein VB137_16430 [Burkholderia sp.]
MVVTDIARELRLPLAHVEHEMERVRLEVEGGLFTPALLPIENAGIPFVVEGWGGRVS